MLDFISPHTKESLDALDCTRGSIDSLTDRETLWAERISAQNCTRHLSDERFLARAEFDAETDLEKELCTRLDGALAKLWSLREALDDIDKAEEAVRELDRRITELDKECDALAEKVPDTESKSLDGNDAKLLEDALAANAAKNGILTRIDTVMSAAHRRKRKTVDLTELTKARFPLK